MNCRSPAIKHEMDGSKRSEVTPPSERDQRTSRADAGRDTASLPRKRDQKASNKATNSSHAFQGLICCICGTTACTKFSHRLAQVETCRRASRASKACTLNRADAVESPKRPVLVRPAAIYHMPIAPGQLDPFVLLPLKGIPKDAIDQFHQYFTCQAGSVFDPDRPLSFDVRLASLRFRQSIESAAMCASVATMAATLNAFRNQKSTTPSVELLALHAISLRALRDEIEGLNGAKFSENTILAAISIATSCGIAFPDAQVARSHWQGVLALYNSRNPTLWSGPVIGWVDNFEWWLTVLAGQKPRNRPWPVLVPHERVSRIERYGKAFRPLFERMLKMDDVAPKLFTLCLNMCRGTEMLESLAKRSPQTQDTYFDYYRLVLMNQSTIVSGIVKDSNTLAECINITITICFMLLLRVLPYHSPLHILCSRLRTTIGNCGLFEFVDSPASTTSPRVIVEEATGAEQVGQFDVPMQDVYIWMLAICTCAARRSDDRSCQDWATSALRGIHDTKNHTDMWQTETLRCSRLFCWSDDFLSKHLLEVDL